MYGSKIFIRIHYKLQNHCTVNVCRLDKNYIVILNSRHLLIDCIPCSYDTIRDQIMSAFLRQIQEIPRSLIFRPRSRRDLQSRLPKQNN